MTDQQISTASLLLYSSTHTNKDLHGPEHSLESRLILIWMFVVLSIVGIFGNSFSIFLLTGTRKTKYRSILSSTYRIYIVGLAVADNGLLFFMGILRYVVVDFIYETEKSSWFYEVYLCRWHRLIMHAFHNAAVWLLVVMAVDRFIAVWFPFKYREMKHNSAKALKITATVFLLSLLFATPYLAVGALYVDAEPRKNSTQGITSKDELPFIISENALAAENITQSTTEISKHQEVNSNADMDKIVNGCALTASLNDNWSFAFNVIFHVLLAFFIPYVVLLVLNIITVWHLHSSPMENGSRRRPHLNRRITIMMLVVCFTFIILWMPQAFLLMTQTDAHSHDETKNEILYSLAHFSGLLNSALNFVLYCFTVRKFRMAAWINLRYFFCKKDNGAWLTSQATMLQPTLLRKNYQISCLNSNGNNSRRSNLINSSRMDSQIVNQLKNIKQSNACELVSLVESRYISSCQQIGSDVTDKSIK